MKVGDRVVVRNQSKPHLQFLGVWTIRELCGEFVEITDETGRMSARVPVITIDLAADVLVTVIPQQLVDPISETLMHEMSTKKLLRDGVTVAQMRDIARQVCQLVATYGTEENDDDPNRVH